MAKAKATNGSGGSNGASVEQQKRSNRLRIKVVLMELKALLPILSADMDDTTRDDTARTLIMCRDKLTMVATFFERRPTKQATPPAAPEVARG